MKSTQLLTIRGRQMSNTQLKQDLGFKMEKKWGETEAWRKTASDGTEVILFSSHDAKEIRSVGGKMPKRPHRLFARCKCCGDLIPAGRLHQHYKKH